MRPRCSARSAMRATLVDDVEAELHLRRSARRSSRCSGRSSRAISSIRRSRDCARPSASCDSAFRLIRRLRDAAVEPGAFLSHGAHGRDRVLRQPAESRRSRAACSRPRRTTTTRSTRTPRELLAPASPRDRPRENSGEALRELHRGSSSASGRMTGRDAVIAAADMLCATTRAAPRRCANATASRSSTTRRNSRTAELRLLTRDLRRAARRRHALRRPGIGDRRRADDAAGEQRLRARRVARRAARGAPHPARRGPADRRPSREEAEADRRSASRRGSPKGRRPERIAVLFRSVRHTSNSTRHALLDRNVPAIDRGRRQRLRRPARARRARAPVERPRSVSSRMDAAHARRIRRSRSPTRRSPSSAASRPIRSARSSRSTRSRRRRRERADGTRKRDLRLGWNVIRGEQDEALSDDAAARLRRFRGLREGWLQVMHEAPFERFARTVWREGLAREGEPGSARARAQQIVLRRLARAARRVSRESRDATVGDVLEYAQARIGCSRPPHRWAPRPRTGRVVRGFVRLLSVESARGTRVRSRRRSKRASRCVSALVLAGRFSLQSAAGHDTEGQRR